MKKIITVVLISLIIPMLTQAGGNSGSTNSNANSNENTNISNMNQGIWWNQNYSGCDWAPVPQFPVQTFPQAVTFIPPRTPESDPNFIPFKHIYLGEFGQVEWTKDMLKGFQEDSSVKTYVHLTKKLPSKSTVKVYSKIPEGYIPVGIITAVGWNHKTLSTSVWGYAGEAAIDYGVDLVLIEEGNNTMVTHSTYGAGTANGLTSFLNPVTALAGLINLNLSKQYSGERKWVWIRFGAIAPVGSGVNEVIRKEEIDKEPVTYYVPGHPNYMIPLVFDVSNKGSW